MAKVRPEDNFKGKEGTINNAVPSKPSQKHLEEKGCRSPQTAIAIDVMFLMMLWHEPLTIRQLWESSEHMFGRTFAEHLAYTKVAMLESRGLVKVSHYTPTDFRPARVWKLTWRGVGAVRGYRKTMRLLMGGAPGWRNEDAAFPKGAAAPQRGEE